MLRRSFIAGGLAPLLRAQPPGIERWIGWSNLSTPGEAWFLPRFCVIPGKTRRLIMTMQAITGSDVYQPVHWSESSDDGKSWSEPKAVPGMGRKITASGLTEALCDTVPEHHPQTGCVIALAQNIYYSDEKLTQPYEQRWPYYAVLTAKGDWRPPKKLEWDHPDAPNMYTGGAAQRVTLADGSILLPLCHKPASRPDFAVTVVACAFDGTTMRVVETGSTLRFSSGRGLLEPSLVSFDGRYFLTIRAENGQGFVAASPDGLHWDRMSAWAWDDGEIVTTSTTQQHWLGSPRGLHLVYTRKDESNRNVFRWRAPLYMADVDAARLRLIRRSEITVFALNADGVSHPEAVEHYGNFHAGRLDSESALVSVGTVIPATWKGAVRFARLRLSSQ